MIAIASIRDSKSGDYMFTEEVTADEIKYKTLKPWQLARAFFDKMHGIPDNILIIENDKEIERWYAGTDYPDENPYVIGLS